MLLRAPRKSKLKIRANKHCKLFFRANTVEELGAIPLDYNDLRIKEQIIAEGPFDVIIDSVKTPLSDWSTRTMEIWRNSVYVSLRSPLLRDTDRYGLAMGLASTACKFVCEAFPVN